ncbi:MAG: ACT domain-containing protein [Clostridiales bacterium]|nr:ACT domain-containing protein [Clostridiales bacterium]MCD8215894.1 ACT domain-containing protein [Clostridiales bacterium]
MFIKQLSIFVENRPGRINDVTKALAENNINVICVSLSDTADYGVFRLIVSNPKAAQDVLKEKGFSSTLTDVVGVKLPHHFGMLNKMTEALSEAGVNLLYIYAFTSGKDNAAVIIKTSDNKKAKEAVKAAGLEILNPSAAYNL